MSGNSRQTKKSVSLFGFNIFKPRKPTRRVDDSHEDIHNTGRVYPSDEDGKGPFKVADPAIDIKTSAFIAHFHATRVSESNCQITRISESNCQVYQSAKA
ncbi:hypothetical protein P3X46_005609 [Hevea brasiliensis]|uniref:Uncharacterized protein n=1 Tax=Hevea brasiliensis TaxID=3981 RepID=A0ABQ9N185_HEVBR|nr:hypothetical protein P3X46_005609 [Hevea brasiliensis]